MPTIAELLVRTFTFTVILLEAAKGEVTRLLGQFQGASPVPARNLGGGMVCYWPRMSVLG
ncbi:hypothetical protein GCM10010245_47400 [Streptomyces spectabilis]|nr:hypothetical protein GCM10010245_47400 [Streptomyces spectabilis]